MSSTQPGDQRGLSLPSRRKNVSVSRRMSSEDEGGDSVGPLSRDSLEGTRRYYGLSSSPNPETPRQRTISATNSPRPLSATPSESSYTMRSPPRNQAPLPVPRGFLAPQKPAAARRLEQRERTATVSTSGRPSVDSRRQESEPATTPDLPSSGPYPSPYTGGRPGSPPIGLGLGVGISPQQPAPVAKGGAASPPHTPRHSKLPPQPLQTPTRPGDSVQGHEAAHWERATDTSSPSGGNVTNLSSDHLVDAYGVTYEKGRSGTIGSDAPLTGGSGPTRYSNGSSNLQKRTVPKMYGFRQTTERKYQALENKSTTFFCGGRLMTGGDSPLSFIISVVIILGLSGVWIGTTGVWLWQHGHEYGLASGGGIAIVIIFVYLFGLTMSSMIAASFREPGILPRDLDPDPPYTPVDTYWEADSREIKVGKDGKDIVQVKYCETCRSYRPPRCSHCRLCGNCVEGIDHHCAYLHGCVGRRNYCAFLVFVIAACISDIYIVIFSAVHFSLLCHHEHISFRTALGDSPGAAVSFLLGIIVLAPVIFLLYYHIRLLLFNLTTIEQIRASASSNLFRATQRPYNPFAAKSHWRNVALASIGRPQFPSWIDASGFVVEDNRRVNPALTTPEKYLELV